MKMSLIPKKKEPPGIKGKKPTAAEKEGRRESQSTGKKGCAHWVKVAGEGRQKRDQKQERGHRMGQA